MNLYIKGKQAQSCVYCIDEIETKPLSGHTDNECEWLSLIEAMKFISGNQEENEYNVFTDSVLLYRQITGKYRIKSKNLKEIYFKWNQYKNILRDLNIIYHYISGIYNPARRYLYENCN